MKKSVLYAAAICAAMVPSMANAQDVTVVGVEETEVLNEIPCKTQYYVNKGDNWYLQFGAGIAAPFVEGKSATDRHSSLSVNYNFGVGKWFSPYLGWRLSFNGGPLHTYTNGWTKSKYVNANLDLTWDMFNSLGGVNQNRVFSLIPFVGIGGAYQWDFSRPGGTIANDGKPKTNSWTLPVSAGLQARLRLCKYVDFFAEARAGFYGDNFNNASYGRPVDINVTLNGGFIVTFGGREYKEYNPCAYLAYIDNLNGQVNDLRAALATTGAALAAAEAQLPCPEVNEVEVVNVQPAPLMATVRFSLNSSRITNTEMVNVYNISKWMQENPEQNVAIVGYADRDTGTSSYNMGLSQRRAEAVRDALVNNYGINPDRLSIQAEGSDVQPYDVNKWNRIVIFNVAQ